MTHVATEIDFEALREQEAEELAQKQMNHLASRIEVAEKLGNNELAERLARRLWEMKCGWY